MPEAETFDLPPDDLPPVPENGVAQERPPKEDKRPAYRRAAARDADGKERPRAPMRPPGSPPLDFDAASAAAHPDRVGNGKGDWPTQAGALWLKILDWLPSQRIGEEIATPDDVLIGIERLSGGGQSGAATLEPLGGATVAGDDNESGDAALMRVITDTYHVPVSDPRARATFRLRFYWRRGGGGVIKQSEGFTLDAPQNIRRARLARDQGAETADPLGPLPTAMANGQPLPPGVPPEILMELGELRAKVHGKPNPTPTAAGVPVNIEAQLELARMEVRLQAEREKSALELKIKEMEAKSREDALNARFAALEARMSAGPQKTVAQEVVETLKALGLLVPGPDGQPVAAGAGTPYTGPQITPAQQIAAAAQVLADEADAKAKAREVVRKSLGLEEPSTELVEREPEKPEEQGFWDKMAKKLGDNLDVFGQMGLAAVAPIADAVLQPGVAATVKGAAAAAQEQLSKKAAGRPAVQQPGWQAPPKA